MFFSSIVFGVKERQPEDRSISRLIIRNSYTCTPALIGELLLFYPATVGLESVADPDPPVPGTFSDRDPDENFEIFTFNIDLLNLRMGN